MEISEFNELVSNSYEERPRFEIDCLFRHCDVRGLGYISKEEFKEALTRPINFDEKITTTIHDLITPLKTALG
jgi:Ca2+-binding EF-hand superfamily protein